MLKIAPALGALGLAVPFSAVLAQAGDPFTITATAERRADSNVFRLSDDVPPALVLGEPGRSDDITRYGLGARFENRYGLQRVLANATWTKQNYQRFDQLDHSAYGLRGEWGWALGEMWSGLLSHDRQRYLADLADIRTKDMVTEHRTDATADLRFHPSWTLGAGVHYASAERSTLEVLDHDDMRTDVHLRYVGNPGNSVGVRAAWKHIDFPQRQLVRGALVDNSQTIFDLQGTVDWAVTGNSRLSGGIGYERVEYDELEERNFDGIAGRLSHTWNVTGKTSLKTSLWREVSANTSLASSVLTEGWSLAPTWIYSPKLGVELNVQREELEYRSPTLNDVVGRQDTVRSYNANLKYEILRNILMVIGYERAHRDSTQRFGDYRYQAWRVGVQAVF